MLWMFDARWLFGIRHSIHEHLLVVPFAMNIVLLGITAYDRTQTECLMEKWRLGEVMALKAALTILEIAMYTILLVRRQQVTSIGSVAQPKTPIVQP